MDKKVRQRIARGKELLATSKHAAIATVNADGSPHCSPVFFAYSPDASSIYWCSSPDSLHSQNVQRTGSIFVVVYDRNEKGGVYSKAEKAHELASEELEAALEVLNQKQVQEQRPLLCREDYSQESPQRVYGAQVVGFWVNATERGTDGKIIRDRRYEIKVEELMA